MLSVIANLAEPKMLTRSVSGSRATIDAGSKRQTAGPNTGSIDEYGGTQPVALVGLPDTACAAPGTEATFAGKVLPEVVVTWFSTLYEWLAKPRSRPYSADSFWNEPTSITLKRSVARLPMPQLRLARLE